MQEQVNDVKVEIDGGKNIFLWRKSAHDHVSIVNYEQRKYNRT